LLLKGHEEVARASLPLECCDMALLRVLHGASMPDPGELARLLKSGEFSLGAAPAAQPAAPSEAPAASAIPDSFAGLVALMGRNHIAVQSVLEDAFRIVHYEPCNIGFQLRGNLPPGFLEDLNRALLAETGMRWDVVISEGQAAPTLREQADQQQRDADFQILDSPLVKAALAAFPDAEVNVDGRNISLKKEAEVRSLRA
jgi:DNA polymerase III subunit gamma/tau